MQRLKALTRRICRPVLISVLLLGAGACSTSAPDSARRGAVPIHKMDVESLERLAIQFAEAGEADMALKFYGQALAAEPDNPRFHAAVGALYVSQGERERARGHFKGALEADPYYEKALTGLAGLYIGDMRPRDANDLLKRLHANGNGTARSFNLQAVTLDLMQKPQDARRAYAQALVLSPEDGAVLGNMALSMALSGEYAAARDIFSQLAEKEENSSYAQEGLALVAAIAGDADKAYDIAQQYMPADMAQANRGFYQRLSVLSADEKAWAVFFGRLPAAETSDIEKTEDESPKGDPEDEADNRALADRLSVAPVMAEAIGPDENGSNKDTALSFTSSELTDADIGDVGKLETEAMPETEILSKAETGTKTDEATAIIPNEVIEKMAPDTDPSSQPLAPAVEDSLTAMAGDERAEAETIPFYHLQLGSFSSEDRLKRGWDSVKDLVDLKGFSPFFENVATNDDKQVMRLLVGPVQGYRAASAVCDALKKDDADCVVLPVRPDAKPLISKP